MCFFYKMCIFVAGRQRIVNWSHPGLLRIMQSRAGSRELSDNSIDNDDDDDDDDDEDDDDDDDLELFAITRVPKWSLQPRVLPVRQRCNSEPEAFYERRGRRSIWRPNNGAFT